MELQQKERGKAFFQLQKWLKRACIGQVTDSFTERVNIINDDDNATEDTLKSDQGNHKLKARFGRR